jgi:Flp pilus assembly protein protease CpaA
MEIPYDTRTLLLGIHVVVAIIAFLFAAVTYAGSGELAATGVRALLGVLVLGLGLSLYHVRGKQE